MAGRRPKPTEQKLLQGNPGRRPLNKNEPKPATGAPTMPRWLSKAARAEWKEIVPILLGMKVLTRADGKALAAYCQSYSMWKQAQEEVDANGITFLEQAAIEDDDGKTVLVTLKIRKNPAVTVAENSMKIMKGFLVEFGLSPASRARLKTENGEESEDPMESFLRRKSASAATQ